MLYYKSKEKIDMGYRSEVVLYVGPEVMPQFMVTMSRSQQARELCFADADHMIKDYNGEKGSFLFRRGLLPTSLLMVLCEFFSSLLVKFACYKKRFDS